jgi:multiple sugar transport system permease protein/putative chitobiose transport system permease protein
MFKSGFDIALFNTTFVTVTTIAGGILVTSMAGFAFAKIDFPLKSFLFTVCIVSFMIPFQAIAIPLFVVVRRLEWTNTYQGLIVPALFNGIVILLFRQFYRGVPNALVDSALSDGASWWQIYSRIFLPISKPAAISAGLVFFVFQWLAFLWPLLVNPMPRFQVLQVTVAKFATEYSILWNQQFAATIISSILPIVVILYLQKHFVGVVGTEIKG